jgi:hypothetical protein
MKTAPIHPFAGCRLPLLAIAALSICESSLAQVPADPTTLPGLAHLWRGDGDGLDSVGQEHLKVGSGITFVSGVRGSAFKFPGLPDVTVGNTNPPLRHLKNSFSMVFWVRPEQPRTASAQTTRGFTGAGGHQYAIFPDHGGDDLVGGAGAGVSVGTNGISVGEHRFAYLPTPLVWNGTVSGWTHVAVVYDRYVPNLYVNGQWVKTGLDTDLRSVITPGDIFPSKTFGSFLNYGPFQGSLDEVGIFGRALTASEVASLAGLNPPPPPVNDPPRLLNLNFGVNLTPVRRGPAAIGTGPNDIWNLYSRDNAEGGIRQSGTLTNMLWADGAGSTADLLIENAAGASNNGYPDAMMGIYLQPFPSGGNIRTTLRDLPVGRYSLYAYGHGGPADSHNSIFNLQSAGINLGDQATASDSQWKSPVWDEGAQYVVYRNFFVGPDRTLILTSKPGSGPTAAINGLQLVYHDNQPVAFYPAPGFFTNSITFQILGGGSGRTVRYTLDGSEPSATSPTYASSPVRLLASAVVKAQLFDGTAPISPVVAGEFFRVYAINDGIAASWREQFFGAGYRTDPRVAADADPDNDGATNAQEFINGSSPVDPLSGFAVQVRQVPSIVWRSVPGAGYRVLRKDTLTDAAWTEIRRVTATEAQSTFTDESVADVPRFYLIEAVKP